MDEDFSVQLRHDPKETGDFAKHGWVALLLDGVEVARNDMFQHNRCFRNFDANCQELIASLSKAVEAAAAEKATAAALVAEFEAEKAAAEKVAIYALTEQVEGIAIKSFVDSAFRTRREYEEAAKMGPSQFLAAEQAAAAAFAAKGTAGTGAGAA